MIIKTASGKTIDTDKLGDIPAAVLEKLDEINAFFVNMKVPYFLRFYDHAGKGSGCQSIIHPTDDPTKVTTIFIAQCVAMIERSMPGYKVAIIAPEGEEFPAAS